MGRRGWEDGGGGVGRGRVIREGMKEAMAERWGRCGVGDGGVGGRKVAG